MPTPFAANRRPTLILAVMLCSCVVALSIQARRRRGESLAEGVVLDATAVGLRGLNALRSAGLDVLEHGRARTALLAENRALRERVVSLEAELLKLRDSERERQRLLLLLENKPRPPEGTLPARVIAVETTPLSHVAILDRGREDGLQMGGVVVAARGLLGRVIAVGARTARVQLITDRLAAAGVVLSRTGRPAVAKGDGSGRVVLKYVPTIADVSEGDIVVTAGTDGVYPRDLTLGRVLPVQRGGRVLFLDLTVAVEADARVEPVVFVLPPVLRNSSTPGDPREGSLGGSPRAGPNGPRR